MALTGQNITDGIYQGCDWLIEDTVTDADNGGPKDLTGATIEWIMQPNSASPTPTIKIANATITDAKNGVFQVSVDKSQTNVDKGSYMYYCIVTDALGKREPVTVGTIIVSALPSG